MAKKNYKKSEKREVRYSELNNYIYNEQEDLIYTLPDEELKELQNEIEWQQQMAKEEIDELKDLIELGELKYRYIEAYIQLGRETIDTVSYFNKIFDYKLSTLIAPRGYWHSAEGIIPIKDIISNKKYNKNCKKWLDDFEGFIKYNEYDLNHQLILVANKYILPLIKEKKLEFEN
ncbi:hypothetical protein [Solibacillus sp. CAU 1738]|uniref:hypothetical protein n=1 Tax=Solibacillus sp. CAU 1738 TaxID=3140363 RepID=UPI0032607251